MRGSWPRGWRDPLTKPKPLYDFLPRGCLGPPGSRKVQERPSCTSWRAEMEAPLSPPPRPPTESPEEAAGDQESEDDLSASRTSLERQAPHRGNTMVHVCWHRNTSVSMVDFSVAVEVGAGQGLLRVRGAATWAAAEPPVWASVHPQAVCPLMVFSCSPGPLLSWSQS